MATASNVLRTCGLFLNLIFLVHFVTAKSPHPKIQELSVDSVKCDLNNCKYLLSVKGGEFLGHIPWRLTSVETEGSGCEIIYPNYELKEIETAQWNSRIEVSVPNISGKIFFCLGDAATKLHFSSTWVHQGQQYFLEPKKDVTVSQEHARNTTESKSNSSQNQETTQMIQNLTNDFDNKTQGVDSNWTDLTHDIDVNYLPNLPRPTREEQNDIEVLVNHKYVPLNKLIEENEIKTKKYVDLLDNNNYLKVQDDNKEHILANNNVNSESYSNTINNYDYAKEIINKIDLVLTKVQSNKNKRDMKDVNFVNTKVNNYSSDPLSNISETLLSNTHIENNISPTYFQEIEEDNDNVIANKDAKQIIEKLDNLLAKIDMIKCYSRRPYSNDLIASKIQSSGMPSLNRVSNNVPLYIKPPSINMDPVEYPQVASSLSIDIPYLPPEVSSPDVSPSDTKLLDVKSSKMNSFDLGPNIRNKRQMPEDMFTSVRSAVRPILIEGIRVEDSAKEPKIIEGGIPSVLAESSVTLRVYSAGLTERTVIAFTHDAQPYGQPCKFLLKGEYMVKEGSLQHNTALFQIYVPPSITGSKLYICAKNLHPQREAIDDQEKYIHQGVETWKMIASHNKLLPLWMAIGLILFCLMFSALFSGLNLGLMSLDRTELKIISNTGTEQERKYARAIMPVRDHGNYLLCSILLGNVAVNSTFTILLDELTSGLFAVIFSTLAIVLLGEITPQAICSRHGLMVGARSIMVTKGVMAVTAPLSFPVSKLLDYFLGEEIGNVYNRERLKELVKVTTDVNDLDKDEVNIISGALEMRKKTVKDVMTKLEDVFMLPITSVLDFETMSEIVKSGYSRIPVYENTRGNILTVLFIKDLAFVDPDDNTPLRTLCQYYQNAAHFVFEDVTLDVMFKQFKDGHKGHMAFVHRINNEGEGDPFYETIGLVTLEDVIEEMIQSEIVDETDVFLDNRSKRRRRPQNKLQDFAAFAERHENQRIHISPQLTLATFQFLSTSVDAFRPDTVSETVLRRLLRQDVIQHIKIKEKTKRDPHTYVFQQGKPVDYFVLILEGRVEVTVGRENLVFEAGPFTYFGVQALTQNVGVAESPTPSAMGSLQNINMDAMLRHTFVPDYSVRAITSVFYLTVKRSLYLAAKRATLMEKGNISKGGTTTQEFDTEVDKLLQSVDEDLSITGEHKTPSRQVSPHPIPVSPAARSVDGRNGHAYQAPHRNSQSDEQERLLK